MYVRNVGNATAVNVSLAAGFETGQIQLSCNDIPWLKVEASVISHWRCPQSGEILPIRPWQPGSPFDRGFDREYDLSATLDMDVPVKDYSAAFNIEIVIRADKLAPAHYLLHCEFVKDETR
jgi:hypothetical protein